MTFAFPAVLVLLLAVPGFALALLLRDWQHRDRWRNLIAPKLEAHLVRRSSKRRLWLFRSLLMLGAGLLIVALARPQWGTETRETAVTGRQILIALDISRSMLATDTPPSRLESARGHALSLVDKLRGEQVAIAAFASYATQLSPFTDDHLAQVDLINQLNPDFMPVAGTRASKLLSCAELAMSHSAAESKLLIVLSDGEFHDDLDETALDSLKRQGVRILALGIGSEQGSPLPPATPDDEFFTDRQGRIVISRYQSEFLDQMSLATNGKSVRLRPDESPIPYLMSLLEEIESAPGTSRFNEVPIERFAWFLLPGLLLIATASATQFPPSPKRSAHTASTKLVSAVGSSTLPSSSKSAPAPDHASTTSQIASFTPKSLTLAMVLASLSPASPATATPADFGKTQSLTDLQSPEEFAAARTHIASQLNQHRTSPVNSAKHFANLGKVSLADALAQYRQLRHTILHQDRSNLPPNPAPQRSQILNRCQQASDAFDSAIAAAALASPEHRRQLKQDLRHDLNTLHQLVTILENLPPELDPASQPPAANAQKPQSPDPDTNKDSPHPDAQDPVRPDDQMNDPPDDISEADDPTAKPSAPQDSTTDPEAQSERPAPAPQEFTPRPGESEQDLARRILSEFSEALPPPKRKPSAFDTQPAKDW